MEGASPRLVKEGKALPKFGGAFSPGGSLLFISMLATSYLAHYNAAAYYDELENPTLPRCNRVVYGGFAMAVGFFVAIAAAGHRTFGAASQGLILNSFAGADKLANAARALVGVAVACTYPLLFKGVRDGYFDIAKVSPANQEKQRTPATIAMVALTVLAGIKITDLGFVVAFGGAILGSAIIYVIPSQIALSACKKGKLALGGAEKLACRSINVMGYVLAVLGGTASVLSRMASRSRTSALKVSSSHRGTRAAAAILGGADRSYPSACRVAEAWVVAVGANVVPVARPGAGRRL